MAVPYQHGARYIKEQVSSMVKPYQHGARYIKERVSSMVKPYQDEASSGEVAPSPAHITSPHEHNAPSSGAIAPRMYMPSEDEASHPSVKEAPSFSRITSHSEHDAPSFGTGHVHGYKHSLHEAPYASVEEAPSISQITSPYERSALSSEAGSLSSYEHSLREAPYPSVEEAPRTSPIISRYEDSAPSFDTIATRMSTPSQEEAPHLYVEGAHLRTPDLHCDPHTTVSFDSVPTAVKQLPASPVEAGHDDASQLVDGLIGHLAQTLRSSGFLNDMLMEETRAGLDRCGNHAVSNAMSALARKFAVQLVDQFPATLAEQLDGSSAPRTSTEYRQYLDDFVGENLGKVFGSDNSSVKNLAREAADKVPAISSRFDLSTEQATELVVLGLYDFVIMCDDSMSMLQDNRLEALADTLQRVADIATLLMPDGISIRFLHCNERSIGRSLDHLKSREEIQDVSYRMTLQPYGTPLGTMLKQKIVEPLIIRKSERQLLKKPVIVVMITDGEANNEPENQLRDTIRDCKRRLQAQGYGKATAMFLISRVGNSDQARRFIEGIGRDPEVGSMVYTNTADISRKRELFDMIGDKAYTKWLIELFLAALRGQAN